MWYIFSTLKRYVPLFVLVAVIAAVIGVSQYAERAKQRAEDRAKEAKAAAVAKGDDDKSADDAQYAYRPPIWARYFTWPDGVGSCAVILTLLVIAWQSIETRASAQATQASVVLMKRQADAMDDQNKTTQNKERARLSISGVSKPEFQPLGTFSSTANSVPVIIHIFVTIDGSSHAYDVDGFGELRIDPVPDKKHVASGIRLRLPRIIRFTETIPIKVPVTGSGDIAGLLTGGDFTYIPANLADEVREGRQYLRITGAIHYKDVFGNSHRTPFDYAWFVPGYDSTWRWIEGCHWMDQSAQST